MAVTESSLSEAAAGRSSEVNSPAVTEVTAERSSLAAGMEDNDNHSSEEELEDIIGNSALKKV